MDPVTLIVVPGFLGGLVIALLFVRLREPLRVGVVLIIRRRRSGPLPSSSQRTGANTTLSIATPPPGGSDDSTAPRSRTRLERPAAAAGSGLK